MPTDPLVAGASRLATKHKLSIAARYLLYALLVVCDDDGWAPYTSFRKINGIGHGPPMSERRLLRAARRLESLGLVYRNVRRGGQPADWLVNLPMLRKEAGQQE